MYTSPNGGTVPGQALDQANSMWASMATANPMSPADLAKTSAGLTAASGQLAATQTPQARQTYVNNGDIPAIQNNYEDLAKKLYDIDKGIASSGQFNPTPPADAISSPGVAASPLALTASILGNDKFTSPNPAIGMQTKIAGNNNVVDLLNMLNDSLGKELSSRKNTYASTVKGQQSVVDAFLNLLNKNSEIGMNKYNQQQENYRAGLSIALQQMTNPSLKLKQLSTLFRPGADGYVSPENYQEVKQQASRLGLSGAEFDGAFDSFRNPSNPYYGLTLSTSGEQQQQQSQKVGAAALSQIDTLMDSWKKMSPTEKTLAKIPGLSANLPGLTPNQTQMQAIFFNDIIGALRQSAIGGRLTQTEITWLNNQLPGPGDSESTAQAKIDTMKRNIASKLQQPDYVIGQQGQSIDLGNTPKPGHSPAPGGANDPLGIR